MQNISLVGTESFYDGYSGDPNSKISGISNWLDSSWQDNIEDGSGDYSADFSVESKSAVEVPSSALRGCSQCCGGEVSCVELCERRSDAQDWLHNNWSGYSSPDVVLVVDYYGGDDAEGSNQDTYGCAAVANAGNDSGKTAIIDTYYEDNNQLDSNFTEVKTEGVGFHEVGHEYCALHEDSSIYYDDESTLMYSPGAGVADCTNNGTSETIKNDVSACSKSVIQCYIDAGGADDCNSCY